jgi:hypothetical protein
VIVTFVALFLFGCRVQKESDGSLKFKSLEASVTELIAMALDPDDADKRRMGIMGLSEHPWGLKETVRVTDDKGKVHNVEVLKVYHLIASMPHEDPTVRCVAVSALGRAGNAKYIATVLACLEDDNATLRWDSAIALDNVIGPQAIQPLVDHALRDPSMDVRSACAKALRHYKQQPVAEALCRILNDQEFSVRFQAHASLVEVTGRDMEYDVDAWRTTLAHNPLTTQPK